MQPTTGSEESNSKTIDSLIFGYLRRREYTETLQCLMRESPHLKSTDQLTVSGQVIVNINDIVFDKNLERIIGSFLETGRFDVPSEFLEIGSRLRQLSSDFSQLTSLNLTHSDAQKKLYGKKVRSRGRHNHNTHDSSHILNSVSVGYDMQMSQDHPHANFTPHQPFFHNLSPAPSAGLTPTTTSQYQSTVVTVAGSDLQMGDQFDVNNVFRNSMDVPTAPQAIIRHSNQSEISQNIESMMDTNHSENATRRKSQHPQPLSERVKHTANKLAVSLQEGQRDSGGDLQSTSTVSLLSSIDDRAMLALNQMLSVDNLDEVFSGLDFDEMAIFNKDLINEHNTSESLPRVPSVMNSHLEDVPMRESDEITDNHVAVQQNLPPQTEDVQSLSAGRATIKNQIKETDKNVTEGKPYQRPGARDHIRSSGTLGSRRSAKPDPSISIVAIPAFEVHSDNVAPVETYKEKREKETREVREVKELEKEQERHEEEEPSLHVRSSYSEKHTDRPAERRDVERQRRDRDDDLRHRDNLRTEAPSPALSDATVSSTASKRDRESVRDREIREKDSRRERERRETYDRTREMMNELFSDDGGRPSSRESASSQPRLSSKDRENERRQKEIERERQKERDREKRRREKEREQKADQTLDDRRSRRDRDDDVTNRATTSRSIPQHLGQIGRSMVKEKDREMRNDKGDTSKSVRDARESEKSKADQRRRARQEEEQHLKRVLDGNRAEENRKELERKKLAQEAERRKLEEDKKRSDDMKKREAAMEKRREEERKRAEELRKRKEEKERELREEKEKRELAVEKAAVRKRKEGNFNFSKAMMQDAKKLIAEKRKSKEREEKVEDPLDKISSEMDQLNRVEDGDIVDMDSSTHNIPEIKSAETIAPTKLLKGSITPTRDKSENRSPATPKTPRRQIMEPVPLFSNPHHVPGGTPPPQIQIRETPKLSNGLEREGESYIYGKMQIYKLGMVLAKINDKRKQMMTANITGGDPSDCPVVELGLDKPLRSSHRKESREKDEKRSESSGGKSQKQRGGEKNSLFSEIFGESDDNGSDEEQEKGESRYSTDSNEEYFPKPKKKKRLDPNEIQSVLNRLHSSDR